MVQHPQHDNRDRRVSRTVQALRSSLFELIQEKHYDSITVQDIIERANVGRSTFYTHFRDKEDLFIGDWKSFLAMIAEHIDVRQAVGGRVAPVEGLMMHLKDFHAYYRALVRSGKTDRLFTLGTEFLAEGIEKKLVADGVQLSIPAAVCAHFISLQIFGSLKWWLDRDMPYEPAEMGRIVNELVAPGIANVTGKEFSKATAVPAFTHVGIH
jgi:AcrR family transcriptional regulator